MKLKPKAEMKRLGIFMTFITLVLMVAFILFLPLFIKYHTMSWYRLFRTEDMYHDFMVGFGAVVFGVLPAIIATCGRCAWIIFKNLDNVSDEKPAA